MIQKPCKITQNYPNRVYYLDFQFTTDWVKLIDYQLITIKTTKQGMKKFHSP